MHLVMMNERKLWESWRIDLKMPTAEGGVEDLPEKKFTRMNCLHDNTDQKNDT